MRVVRFKHIEALAPPFSPMRSWPTYRALANEQPCRIIFHFYCNHILPE